jgi:hypothetical protein
VEDQDVQMSDMTWVSLGAAHPYELGFLPSFVDTSDPDKAAAQFNKRYEYGGWRSIKGFKKLEGPGHIQFPGDPPMVPLFMTHLRDEVIYVYRHGLVAIFQPDGKFEVARLD